MKKSMRILSAILALMMLLGTFSVMGSAYQAYKDGGITTYDDIDKPCFNTEQYASMALDELDRMLAKENIVLTKKDLFNIGNGLDLRSINQALASLDSLYASVSQVIGLLGTAGDLDINAIYVNHNKNSGIITRGAGGNTTDFNLILAVVRFLYDNIGILTAYVDGSISLGILNSVVEDYLFNIRELAFKALYHLMNDSYDILDGDVEDLPYRVEVGSGDMDVLLADLVKYALFGKHTLVGGQYVLPDPDDYKGLIWDFMEDLDTATITSIMNDCNIVNTSADAYAFIEQLLIDAFNYLAVPELNNVTRPWLREVCGVTYDSAKMDPNSPTYDPNYDGEYEEGDLNEHLAAIFDVDGMYIPTYDPNAYPYDTFVQNFNAFLGDALECVLKGEAGTDWTWNTADGDKYLLSNICSVARWILAETGDQFFEPYITVPSSGDIESWNNQQTVSFVLRAILNESVDWMYIDDSQQTIADVCYAAVEQLAWQDIPQMDYVKPVRTNYATDALYYEALVDSMLDILMDVAAYNLNQHFDMNPDVSRTAGASPAVNSTSGLLVYQGNYEAIALLVAKWAIKNYAGMLTSANGAFSNISLAPNNIANATMDSVWADLDTVLNSLIPIKGSSSWLYGDIAGEQLVVKSLLFKYIVYPILGIDDLSQTQKIFMKNTSGDLATKTIKEILIKTVTNLINAIFPGTVTTNFNSLDALVVNSELATIVNNLISSFYTNGSAWVTAALPVVCDLLGLTDAQEFGEMECYMPANYTAAEANSTGIVFQVYNGCSGLNTGYTNESGNFQQDQLYNYVITGTSVTASPAANVQNLGATNLNNQSLSGGANKTVTISGTFQNNTVITYTVYYKVKDETGGYLKVNGSEVTLACTRYCYIDSASKDDSSNDATIDFSGTNDYKLLAAPSVYANKGTSLTSALNYSLAVDDKVGQSAVIGVQSVTPGANSAWIAKNDVSFTSQGAVAQALNPFKVADGYERLNESYNKSNVTAESFAERTTDLYTRNADGISYTLVGQGDEYDPQEEYFTFSTNVDHTANGVKYDENNNILVEDGTYSATAVIKAGSYTASVNVKIFLYDDKGLTSLYNNAVTANRQASDFDDANTEYTAYINALNDAGQLVLDPKENGTFTSKWGSAPAKYTALYQAIKNLDAKSKAADTDALQDAIAGFISANTDSDGNYSNNYYITTPNANYIADNGEPEKAGWNNVQYWSTTQTAGSTTRYAYSYFGMRDVVPHDYKKFRDAKDRAQSLIDSQVKYPPIAPVDPGANASVYERNKYYEEMEDYNKALAQYNIDVENIPALNPVDVAYALAMVNLTGSRLIYITPDNDKLTAFRNSHDVPAAQQGNYSQSTWKDYTTAKNFADYTISLGTAAKPSQITEALGRYVEAYKKLCSGVDYTNLDAAISQAIPYAGGTLTGTVAANIDSLDAAYSDVDAIVALPALADYTEESARAFAQALVRAIDLRKDDLGASSGNQNTVDEAANALNAARTGLTIADSGETGFVPFDISEFDEDTALFWRDDYGAWSVPYVDNQYFDWMFDEHVDGYSMIAGVGVYYSDCSVPDAFKSVNNAYAVWTPNDMGSGTTGSYITLYTDSTQETEIETYYVCLYGDFNGDGDINGTDVDMMSAMGEDYFYDENFDPANMVMGFAADVNGDYMINATDSDMVDQVIAGNWTINQDEENRTDENGIRVTYAES